MVSSSAIQSASTAALGLVAGLLIRRRSSKDQKDLKKLLKGNYGILSPDEKRMASTLVAAGQQHLFQHWPAPGIKDSKKRALLTRLAAEFSVSAQRAEPSRLEVLQAPKVLKRPYTVVGANGERREDPYYWLRDDERENPEVLDHLKAEAAYAKQVLADTEKLQEELYKELRGRIQEADRTVPLREEGWYYYNETVEGLQYSAHKRRRVPASAGPPTEKDQMDTSQEEQVLLDENKEAEKHEFYMTGALAVSHDNEMLAWAEDTSGDEMFTLHIKNMASGKSLLDTPIEGASGAVVWTKNNKSIFYVTKDDLDRPYKVFKHTLGSDPKDDELVFHETDDSFYVGLGESRSREYICVSSGSAITSEMRILEAGKPDSEWKVVLPRQTDVEYEVAHRGDHLFILLRDPERPNSELLVAPIADPTKTTVLLKHSKDVKLDDLEVSKDFLTIFYRSNGLQAATVYKLEAGMPSELQGGEEIKFGEAAYEMGAGAQGDFDSPILRLRYSSLSTPSSTIDYNMRTGQRETKKVQPVLGGFSSSNYKTERLWARAPDGVKVPVSLVYRKGAAKLDGSDPLLLDAYGAYEISNDPGFSRNQLSLIDRGFVYAIAHVRGGGELGRQWYEDGKYLKKRNTFTDMVACAEHLIAEKYTSKDKLCIEGRSAGGLTMGASLNLRPDLYKAAILGVPFVDVLTTMLDDTIPLTTTEWEEWGCPKDKEYYEYMKSYSPVDNIKRAGYPNILVTAGLHDPRVGYWEPAKYVAKLREYKTDSNMLLFKCEMGAGHFSQSGRFDRLKEVAMEMAFLLKCMGMH
ncbi:g3872 [Coccomyxa viridis]|uniref:Prolyl endopeptidase n=1 Tax=Coccomyxa viridis TaxID=1274662 RepID=A0ABP1FNV7_9CHLO